MLLATHGSFGKLSMWPQHYSYPLCERVISDTRSVQPMVPDWGRGVTDVPQGAKLCPSEGHRYKKKLGI